MLGGSFTAALALFALAAPTLAAPRHHESMHRRLNMHRRYLNTTEIDNQIDGLTTSVNRLSAIAESINTEGGAAWIQLVTGMTALQGQVSGVSQALVGQPSITSPDDSAMIAESIHNYVSASDELLQNFLTVNVSMVKGILPPNTFANAGAPVQTAVNALFAKLEYLVPSETNNIKTDRNILDSDVLSVMSTLAGL